MRLLPSSSLLAFVALASAVALVSGEREVSACGGCFHEAPTPAQPVVESSVVSDHRMVLSMSPEQTVLWDQIRYNGDPKEFAWVLPIKPGARIELSRDEWIAALDATTQPTIVQPRPRSVGGGRGDGFGSFGDDYEGNSGCACGAMASSTSAMADNGGASAMDASAASPPPPPPVEVVKQEVVGPYEAVIVRTNEPDALETWLREHGYAIPDSVVPIIEAYAKEKFDFIALRLRPGQGVRAMRPVRVVSQGADPTLPLRMVAAGIGARVGLTLYVISEGRFRPKNFPEGQIDDAKLFWDFQTNRSNYQQLSSGLMSESDGRTWLTEYADRPMTIGGFPQQGRVGSLYDSYYGTCQGQARDDAPWSGVDAGADDAGADAGAVPADAGPDASDGGSLAVDGGGATSTPTPGLCRFGWELCCDFDDLEVAVKGMARTDVWVTRLRADLPASALSQDLSIEAHPSQSTVSNVHQANAPAVPGSTTASVAPRARSPLSVGIVTFGAAALALRVLKRRRRRR